MLWKLAVGFLTGFSGHFAFYDASKTMPAPDLSRSGIGVVITYPIFLLLCDGGNENRCYKANFILSFVSVGLGAMAARYLRVGETQDGENVGSNLSKFKGV